MNQQYLLVCVGGEIRLMRPIVGDMFAPRYAQKGTIGAILPLPEAEGTQTSRSDDSRHHSKSATIH
jgi:hypothetical protein